MKILRLAVLTTFSALLFACSSDLDNQLNQERNLDAGTIKTIVKTSEVSSFADEVLAGIFNFGQSRKATAKVDCYTSKTTDQVTTITFSNCIWGGNEPVNGSIRARYILENNTIGLHITYVNLTMGSIQISGSKKMFFGSSNKLGHLGITLDSDVQMVLDDGTLVLEKGSKIVWYETDTSQEQKVSIEGEWTVTTNGKTYQAIITENLETILPCEYISSGVLLVSENETSASMDFGNGECDDSAIITYMDGITQEISLRD